MASAPDPGDLHSGNLPHPLAQRAEQVNAQLTELRTKIDEVIHQTQELLGELRSPAEPPPEAA